MKRRNGFTLIELIAVIAIIAILSAILVPKIDGYKNSAKKANVRSSAKVFMNAVQAYNASPIPGNKIEKNTSFANALNLLNQNGTVVKGQDVTTFQGFTVGQVKSIYDGDFIIVNGLIKASDGVSNIAEINIE